MNCTVVEYDEMGLIIQITKLQKFIIPKCDTTYNLYIHPIVEDKPALAPLLFPHSYHLNQNFFSMNLNL